MEALPIIQNGKMVNKVLGDEESKILGTTYVMPFNVKKKISVVAFTQNVTNEILEDDGFA